MLYKFQSRATADLIMLEPHARKILELLGKSPEGPGILTVEQIPVAITALETAVHQEEVMLAESEATEDELENTHENTGAVRLRQRAAPFIDMLRRSLAENREVIW